MELAVWRGRRHGAEPDSFSLRWSLGPMPISEFPRSLIDKSATRTRLVGISIMSMGCWLHLLQLRDGLGTSEANHVFSSD
jgi:hypothetical protein